MRAASGMIRQGGDPGRSNPFLGSRQGLSFHHRRCSRFRQTPKLDHNLGLLRRASLARPQQYINRMLFRTRPVNVPTSITTALSVPSKTALRFSKTHLNPVVKRSSVYVLILSHLRASSPARLTSPRLLNLLGLLFQGSVEFDHDQHGESFAEPLLSR